MNLPPDPAAPIDPLDDLIEHYDAGNRLLSEATGMLNSIQAALALAELQSQPVDMTMLTACSGLHHVLTQVRTHYQGLFDLAQHSNDANE